MSLFWGWHRLVLVGSGCDLWSKWCSHIVRNCGTTDQNLPSPTPVFPGCSVFSLWQCFTPLPSALQIISITLISRSVLCWEQGIPTAITNLWRTFLSASLSSCTGNSSLLSFTAKNQGGRWPINPLQQSSTNPYFNQWVFHSAPAPNVFDKVLSSRRLGTSPNPGIQGSRHCYGWCRLHRSLPTGPIPISHRRKTPALTQPLEWWRVRQRCQVAALITPLVS